MAAPVIPCDSCGAPIADADLETGSAVTLLGKRYCNGCKSEAIEHVSLEDIVPGRPVPKAPRPAPAAPKPAPKAPAAKAPPPAPEKRPPTRRTVTRKAPVGAKKSPLVPLAAAAAGLVLVVVAFLLFRGGGAAPPRPDPVSPAPPVAGPSTPEDREARAKVAYLKVEALTTQASASWDRILAAAEQAKTACAGTSYEKRLAEIRATASQEKFADEAARDLGPLIDELKGIAATDPEFKRFAELQAKFEQARQLAAKAGPGRVTEIKQLQLEYNGKYEKIAEPFYTEINEAANALAEEKRYDDALRRIDTFPSNLRLSNAWSSLDRLRQDIERRKKSAAPKK